MNTKMISKKTFEKIIMKLDTTKYYILRDYVSCNHKWYVRRWRLFKKVEIENYYSEFDKEILNSSFSNINDLKRFIKKNNRKNLINKIKKYFRR